MNTKEKALAGSVLRRVADNDAKGGSGGGKGGSAASKWTWAKKTKVPPAAQYHESLLQEEPKVPTIEESVQALQKRIDASESLIVGRISELEGLVRSLIASSYTGSFSNGATMGGSSNGNSFPPRRRKHRLHRSATVGMDQQCASSPPSGGATLEDARFGRQAALSVSTEEPGREARTVLESMGDAERRELRETDAFPSCVTSSPFAA